MSAGNPDQRVYVYAVFSSLPKGPSRTKRRVTSARGLKFATTMAKRYGECSEMLVFLGRKRGRETVQTMKNDGGSKIVWIRAPWYF